MTNIALDAGYRYRKLSTQTDYMTLDNSSVLFEDF